MKQVYAPANAAEAHMLAHLLEQNGIQAHIHGEALQGGVGELPAMGLLQLLVADEDHEAARALILQWERAHAAPTSDEVRERRPLPIWSALVLVAIGLGGGWLLRRAAENNAIPIDASQWGLDQNEDGRDDLTFFYRVGAQLAYKSEADRNFDGAIDETYHYDAAGVVTSRENDDDFDGFVESRTIYRAGNPVRTDVDRNRNGVTDLQLYYTNAVVSREEIHDNLTGRVARANYYENFLLSRSESDLDGDGFLETVRTYDALGEIARTETRPQR